jgi:hypothetical protein
VEDYRRFETISFHLEDKFFLCDLNECEVSDDRSTSVLNDLLGLFHMLWFHDLHSTPILYFEIANSYNDLRFNL